MFRRSWVQIPAPYLYCMDIFSHLFVVKIVILFEKTKINEKEGVDGYFFKKIYRR